MDEPRRDDEHHEPAEEQRNQQSAAEHSPPAEPENGQPSPEGEPEPIDQTVDRVAIGEPDPGGRGPLVDSRVWVSEPDVPEPAEETGYQPKVKAVVKGQEDDPRAPATGVPVVTPPPEPRPADRGAPPPAPPGSPRSKGEPEGGGCGSVLAGTLVGGLLGAILATAVVLLTLYWLNGTLDFNRSRAVLDLESRTETLQRQTEQTRNELDTLASRAGRLEERTQRLEALPPQVEALRSETGQLREETNQTHEQVNQLGEQVDTVRTELGKVRELTETFDAFLVNLRDLLVEIRPLPSPMVTPTARPTRTPPPTPTRTATPEAIPTVQATPTRRATPATEATPAARLVPASGPAGTTFRLTVTNLEPTTEYAVTISNADTGFESVDLVTSDADGTLQLAYGDNFTRLLTPGIYAITVQPGADRTAAPIVVETGLVIREEARPTPGDSLSLEVEPEQLRAGQPLTVTITGAAPNREVEVVLITPGGNRAAVDTRTAAADGRLTITYSGSVTSRWNPGEWTVTVTPARGADQVTATFEVSR